MSPGHVERENYNWLNCCVNDVNWDQSYDDGNWAEEQSKNPKFDEYIMSHVLFHSWLSFFIYYIKVVEYTRESAPSLARTAVDGPHSSR